jgi:hypothetical protein
VKRSHKIIAALAVAVVIASIAFSAWQFYKLQFWRGPDVQFGDQHLKTSVALIELHKVRYGKYPKDLSDLTFTGAWDAIALNSVRYRTNDMQTRYCVEVQRGWIGKPHLTMPPEFWQGTGYDPQLCHQ